MSTCGEHFSIFHFIIYVYYLARRFMHAKRFLFAKYAFESVRRFYRVDVDERPVADLSKLIVVFRKRKLQKYQRFIRIAVTEIIAELISFLLHIFVQIEKLPIKLMKPFANHILHRIDVNTTRSSTWMSKRVSITYCNRLSPGYFVYQCLWNTAARDSSSHQCWNQLSVCSQYFACLLFRLN